MGAITLVKIKIVILRLLLLCKSKNIETFIYFQILLILDDGINFLGFRIFYNHKLIRKKNLRKFEKKLRVLKEDYNNDLIEREKVIEKFEGWIAYVKNADTYKYRRHITRIFNKDFPIDKNKPVEKVKKHQNSSRKHKKQNTFSQHKKHCN